MIVFQHKVVAASALILASVVYWEFNDGCAEALQLLHPPAALRTHAHCLTCHHLPSLQSTLQQCRFCHAQEWNPRGRHCLHSLCHHEACCNANTLCPPGVPKHCSKLLGHVLFPLLLIASTKNLLHSNYYKVWKNYR